MAAPGKTRPITWRQPRLWCLLTACCTLLAGCSTFSPAPYYDPPYYIDDFGRVFYPAGKEPWQGDNLTRGFGSIPREDHSWNAFYAGFPTLIDRPFFGAYTGGSSWYRVYRPPSFGGLYPGPATSNPPGSPVAPVDPAMSATPILPPVGIIRYQPEPDETRQSIDTRRWTDHGPSVRRNPGGARAHRPAAPRPAPRDSATRSRPPPRPERPREIDPG